MHLSQSIASYFNIMAGAGGDEAGAAVVVRSLCHTETLHLHVYLMSLASYYAMSSGTFT